MLQPLYEAWNEKINVISRKDIDHLFVHHILHSLGLAKVVQFQAGAEILDVGTGGGFPGIPLAIMFPDARFHLIDSIGKKITVVENIVTALQLKNVRAEKQRVESINHKYDFIVSRAVTRLAPFHEWVKHKIKKEYNHPIRNGVLYLKGGDLKEELKEAKQKYQLFNLSDYFDDPFFETKKVIYVPL